MQGKRTREGGEACGRRRDVIMSPMCENHTYYGWLRIFIQELARKS